MFTLDEVVSVTQGRLLSGGREQVFSGVSTDTRTLKPGSLFIALRGDRFDGHEFIAQAVVAGAAGVLGSSEAFMHNLRKSGPQFNGTSFILVGDTLSALQKIAGYHRSRFQIPVIAITGSNGKTTTKEMAASILSSRLRVHKNEGNLNNHIGVPLTLLRLEKGHQAAVLEIGINRPGELRTLCGIAKHQVGLITNVGPTHLEFLGSVEGVARAKSEILEGLGGKDVAILNSDDPFFKTFASKVRGRLITFGLKSEADVTASAVEQCGDRGLSFQVKISTGSDPGEASIFIPVMGKHNIYNALGAVAVGISQGMTRSVMREVLDKFKPMSMRSQLIVLKDFHILNDAYNANPNSMKSALDTLATLGQPSQRIAVLGDMLELGEESQAAHRDVGKSVARAGINYLITMGSRAEEIAQGARSAGMEGDRVMCSHEPKEAGEMVLKVAQPGDYILIKGSRNMKMERILEFIDQSK